MGASLRIGVFFLLIASAASAQRIGFLEQNRCDTAPLSASLFPRLVSEDTIAQNKNKNRLRRLAENPFYSYADSLIAFEIYPLIHFRSVNDQRNPSTKELFVNTRGLGIDGKIGSRLYFTTQFQETQARFPNYYAFKVRNAGAAPGMARVKSFKVDAFDYSQVKGLLWYEFRPNVSVSVGSGQHKLGNGARSLILSDFSTPYPFMRFSWTSKSNFWFYEDLRMQLNQGTRFASYATIEPMYIPYGLSLQQFGIQKAGAYTLALVQVVMVNRFKDNKLRPVELSDYSPLPFTRGLIKNHNSRYVLYGLNMAIEPTEGLRIYHQSLLEGANYALQLGILYQKGYTWRYKGRLEFNIQKDDWQGANKLPYEHFNLSMGHPLNMGFREWYFSQQISYGRVVVQAKQVLQHLGKEPVSANTLGTHGSQPSAVNPYYPPNASILHSEWRLAYCLNNHYNLMAFVGLNHRLVYPRQNAVIDMPLLANRIISLGLHTELSNFTTDF